MTMITDPDDLNQGTEVVIDASATPPTIQLVVAGNLSNDGVTLQCLYSFLKEEWKNDPLSNNLAAFDFPMVPITDEFYELVEGWNWADATTRQSIRRGGWLVRNTSGNVTEHWAAIAILNAEADDQAYYDLGAGATAFTFPGNTAEAVQVIDDPNGDGSYVDGYDRSSNIVVYNREQGQLFSSTSTIAAGESSLLAPKLFSLGLPTGTDLNISESDTNIASNAPYTGMTITFYTTPQSRLIGGQSRDFGIIIDGNNGTKQQIYEFVQWALRQTDDQDDGAGTLIGQVMPELLQFVGAELQTKSVTNYQGGGTGVFIDNFNSVDTNDLLFVDNTGTDRAFPFVAAGQLIFNTNLVNDSDAVYRVFFTDGVTSGQEFGNSGSILVDDNGGTDLSGNVSGRGTVAFDFDYDGNNQGGRTPGTDCNVTAIAIGLNSAQYVKTTATITASNTNTINFVAAQERNYDNPV